MAATTEAPFNYDDLLEGTGGSWRSRLIWLALLGTLVVAVATGAWWEFLRGGSAATATIQTATVSLGNVTKSVSTSGTVAAQSTSNLNFTTTGAGSSRITKVNVTLGQQVKQGDVLAELDATDAQSALVSAKLGLATAQSKLNQLLQGGTASALASADQSLQQSQANYDKAVRALQDLQKPADATTIETAQQAVTTAQAQLQQARDARAKIDTDSSASVKTAQSGVTRAQNALTAAQQAQSNAAASITTDQQILYNAETAYCTAPPTTTASFCSSLTAPISSGDQVVLSAVAVASPDHANASSVLTANGSYTKAVSDKLTADNTVTSAHIALSDANDALDKAEAGPAAGQIAVADAAIGSAQAQVDAAQAKLATLQAGPTREAVTAAQADIDTAAASLAAAKAKRDETYAGALPSDIQQQRQSVSQGQNAVDTAQKNLDNTKLIAPFDGTVAALNNQVGDLAGTGTSSTTAAVVLNTPDRVILNLTISETDYGSVKVGQSGTAVFAAIAGRTFPIIIDAIGSNPTTTQGVVNYVARAHFVAGGPGFGGANGAPGSGASGTPGAQGQGAGTFGTPGAGGQFGGRRATAAAETAAAGGAPTTPQAGANAAGTPAAGGGRQRGGGAGASNQRPVPGMNATITIITAQSQNVLRVPNAAVQRDGQNRVVEVQQNDGTTQKVTVQVGLSDATNTEIQSGLDEGATVILPGVTAAAATTGTAAAGRGAGGAGGGFGGFGGGGGGGRPGGD
jgi:HlyD family secretion protein